MYSTTRHLLCLLVFGMSWLELHAQHAHTEVQAWGNIRGLRVDNGHLFRFESSLRAVKGSWKKEQATAMERFWTSYRRIQGVQEVQTQMDSLFFVQQVRDIAPGHAQIAVTFDPHEDLQPGDGAFFYLQLPVPDFANASLKLIEPAILQTDQPLFPVHEQEILRARARGLRVISATRDLQLTVDSSTLILVQKDPISGELGVYLGLNSGPVAARQRSLKIFNLIIDGQTDTEPATLTLFPQYPGSLFLGMGGNFRLQNFRHDPQVIDYCLNNMDVRMGRVEMPWSRWHPVDSISPITAARNGQIHRQVKASMEMAQRLYHLKIPVILSAWFPPAWAATGVVNRNPRNPDGTWGNPLRQEKMEAIYASITDYILYLKEAYGVEISMFSFNESDLGINVRQTAAEHAAFIKGLGAYMKSKGLKTKLLLGDTSDANAAAFVTAALDDPSTWDYIGAVSFHSWRGWDKATLLNWYHAAHQINVPLIVGEGSIDAAAWRYPQIFSEPHYAMEEIKLYVRLMAICQPQTILQWQLTSDYSPLTGGGIFGVDSIPLQPTQRFWNLKQLGMTPPNLAIMPLNGSEDDIFATALGDAKANVYAFHIVNDGPERELLLKGLPPKLKKLRLHTTDAVHGAEKGVSINIVNGEARCRIGATSFTSFFSE